MRIALFILLIPLLYVSCASVNVVGYRHPDHLSESYSNVLVAYPVADLVMRDKVESMIVEMMIKRGIAATASVTLFPPVKKIEEKAFYSKLVEQGIEAVVNISDASQAATPYTLPV